MGHGARGGAHYYNYSSRNLRTSFSSRSRGQPQLPTRDLAFGGGMAITREIIVADTDKEAEALAREGRIIHLE